MVTKADARAFIDSVKKLREAATDAQASMAVGAYEGLNENGALIKSGTRINWNGTIKRAAVDLYDTAENNPDNAPTLWENIEYKEGYRIIPETITTGTAFAKDEYGWWEDVLYKSNLDNNVWTPVQYANAWEIVTE